jgi:hypothetical protein
MTATNPIYSLDELTAHMRHRGYTETEFVVDWDSAGNVIIRGRYEPNDAVAAASSRDVPPVLTARDIARANQHEQGVNTLKGAGVLVVGAIVAFALLFAYYFVTG